MEETSTACARSRSAPWCCTTPGSRCFSGGFVGVDIFFVISGFLITSGLLKDAAGDGISIARFYVRRIRRIVPAYLAVVLAALVVGAFLLLPSEYLALGRSALATSLFVANIHSWSETGYFSGSAISHPLLHMWSLAVEEQYYLIWPIVMMGFFSGCSAGPACPRHGCPG
ncbi:acyltransferase family protein [Novosphingobium colocasiae]